MRNFRPKVVSSLAVSLFLLLVGCSSSTGLVKASGDVFAQSEIHRLTQDPENVKHYRPMSIQEMTPLLPSSLQSRIKPVDKTKLPFPVEKERAYLVSFASGSEKVTRHQLQLTYAQGNEVPITENFFIVRMTETDENPLAHVKPSASGLDSFGNVMRVESLTDDITFYHHIITTNSSYVYNFYKYDDKNQAVNLIVTNAHEMEFYDQGIFYHLAYHTGSTQLDPTLHDQMVALAKDLISVRS
ncbi:MULTISPECIES: hypothetical protein [Brevibacillus]|uniref:Lipoprotein n=1 Tax=Brevibacillus brevis TaxID=1393 RepID=A0A2Z4MD59_BREBE|nr:MULTISPECIES: hypothetical protein [Brevibacillus]AWX54369.1 hypothetical protein AB432_004655 [Brevibacillus brevis]NRR19640.1 hypothetical protein [Brevibacillus sp. MS2.2]